ncbi:MAG: alanine racemase [Clostridiales bacterium]|nr:alanine racemase [Clostridiales bacterium]
MQSTLAVVALGTIRKNAQIIKEYAEGTPLIAVVKDDAYGHGAAYVARALVGIASAFAVSTVNEGVELRLAGIGEEILVFTPPLDKDEVCRAAAYDLTVSITSPAALNLVLKSGERVRAHIALDTGMNRYGFRRGALDRAVKLCKRGGLEITGVYSHLYSPEDAHETKIQRLRFQDGAAVVREAYPEAVRHLAATGGVLAGKENYFDAVRVGIGLYGYLPHGFVNDIGIKPAMRLYATVAHNGKFSGGGVGYAKADKTYGNLHTLRMGYGDGCFRSELKGAVGKLCMDAHLCEGKGVFGRRKLVIGDASEYAARLNTTEYEALLRMGRSAEKRYVPIGGRKTQPSGAI